MARLVDIPRLIFDVMAVIAGIELGLMLLLPRILPGFMKPAEALLDPFLLCLFSAPLVVWRVKSSMDRNSPVEYPGQRGGRWKLPLAVFLVGSGLSVSTAWREYEEETAHASAKVEAMADKLSNEISRRFKLPVYGMRGALGAVEAMPTLDRGGFLRYVTSRDLPTEFPGVRGFGYIEKVMRSDLASFVQHQQRSGVPGFSVRTDGQAEEMFVIRFIEPLANNRPALGYDVGSEGLRRAAVQKARETGRLSMTGTVKLLQDGKKRPGVLLMIPDYRGVGVPVTPELRTKEFLGVVYAPVVIEELLAGVEQSVDQGVDFKLYDSSAESAQLLFERSDPHRRGKRETGEAAPAMSRRRIPLEIGGRSLILSVDGAWAFKREVNPTLVVWIGVGGVLFSLAIALLLWSMLGSRRRALELAQRMTSDLKTSEERTLRALRESEALRSTITECAIVSVTDAKGVITEVNDAFCRISGYSREELLGKTHRMVNSGTHERGFWQDLWKTISSGKPWRGEVCNRAKNGRQYWVESLIAPHLDAQGQVEKYVSIRFEITQKHEAEEEIRSTHRILQSVLDAATTSGIVATNPQGIITIFNRGAEELVGLKAEDVLFLGSPALWHKAQEVIDRGEELTAEMGRSIQGFDVFTWKAKEGTSETRRWTMRHQDGREFPAQLSVTAIKDQAGRITGYLGIFQDISKEIEIQAQLDAAREAAEAAVQAKSLFLAMMTHELRTPMNGVLGMTDILLEELIDPKQLRMAQVIRSSSRSLLDLVDGILDSSKIEAGKLELEHVDFLLPLLLEELEMTLGIRAREKNVGLFVQIDEAVSRGLKGDPGRLRQILTNLVGNALKFTAKGNVSIEVSLKERRGDRSMLRFDVRDTGTGIPAEKLDRLFQVYSQADAGVSREYGGTGLGLAICRQLVELMVGTIGVESTLGKGSCFWFELPFVELAELGEISPALMVAAGAHSRFSGQRILVAEDNPINRMVALSMLGKLGLEAKTAGNGEDALALLEQEPFEIVLMDMHMPILDGLDTTRRIRENSKFSGLPVLALTASTDEKERERCLEAGMDSVLVKPISLEALVQALERFLPEA